MKWLCLIMCMFLLEISCTTESITPTRRSREIIDSIYQRKIILLQPQMDSICRVLNDSLFKISSDSIMTSREVEMINLVK